jgi:hypothetical protein
MRLSPVCVEPKSNVVVSHAAPSNEVMGGFGGVPLGRRLRDGRPYYRDRNGGQVELSAFWLSSIAFAA